MISVEEASRIVLENLPAPQTEEVPFSAALGRVLARDLDATRDMPPFDRAGVDGYAVNAADVERAPVELMVVGESRAGAGFDGSLKPGEAVSIMTGAPVPEGADAVQMIEVCQSLNDGVAVRVAKSVRPRENIAPRGSEAQAGKLVLGKGHRIGPSELAVMATFGFTRVAVYRRPSVAILATGDELVEFDESPGPHQIRNSNAHCLAGQLRYMDLEPEYLGIARDAKCDLREKLLEGLERDVLLITGGVSMGEYDFVRDVFEELGLEMLFNKIAIKPGKPTVFARKDHRLVFGLPGNPLSALVTFECFVRPALGRLCGMKHPELPRVMGELEVDMRQSPGRTGFFPAFARWDANGWKVQPLRWKSSGDIIGFTDANATFIFPKDRSSLSRGETVEIMLLPDFFMRR